MKEIFQKEVDILLERLDEAVAEEMHSSFVNVFRERKTLKSLEVKLEKIRRGAY